MGGTTLGLTKACVSTGRPSMSLHKFSTGTGLSTVFSCTVAGQAAAAMLTRAGPGCATRCCRLSSETSRRLRRPTSGRSLDLLAAQTWTMLLHCQCSNGNALPDRSLIADEFLHLKSPIRFTLAEEVVHCRLIHSLRSTPV